MKTREEHIAFDMNYCQHYTTKPGLNGISCAAGMNLAEIKKVPTGPSGYLMGPCIGGHDLTNPHEHCPNWIRRTREHGEARADAIEASLNRMRVVGSVVAEWRKKLPRGKAEVIECPACKGRLHLSQAASNGHVHGKCETNGCVSWVE